MSFNDRPIEDIDQLTEEDLKRWFKHQGIPLESQQLYKDLLKFLKPYLK